MEISKNLAYQIVNNIKDIINQDLNFMDKNGIIIASTDINRVNTFHEAAKDCVNKKKTIVIEYDNQYKGAKKGINIPVEFNEEIIGVVGITGQRSEVEKYGSIIKKMTEILLKEEWIKENEIQKRDNYRNLLEAIIYNRFEDINSMYSLNQNNKKYLVVSKPIIKYINTDIIERILNVLDSYFYNKNDVLYAFVYQELIILFLDNNRDSIKRILNDIARSINEIINENVVFGISSSFLDLNQAYTYFLQALSSYNWKKQYTSESGTVLFYDDMDLGILLTDISLENRLSFSQKILKDIPKEDIEFYSNLVNIYGQQNGSIKGVSEELFMHKNTIQYRLNRLKEITSYNPREYDGYLILKLAFLLLNNNFHD